MSAGVERDDVLEQQQDLGDLEVQLGLVPFRRTPELSRCAAIPVSVFVVDGTHHVDG
jgi:hypothetical protein